MCEPTLSANHFTNPTRLSPSARVTSVANHASVFHAGPFFTTSSQLTTFSTIINAIATNATVVALMKSPPKIHNASASNTSTANVISRIESAPSFASSSPAHFGTSSPDLTVGG